ncbi:MAG: Nuclear pore complex protein Nup98-Nup96 [Peltula sp. TS41687]|nr:MAG: Nuclear pore complex protein Nup98-Nup96 [Peltula sp. TS41687]
MNRFGKGFGASTSTTQSSPFGAAANKPFGQTSTTTGGGLFGGTTATANTGGGFGGFGTNNNTQTATSAFGGGGGMFGGNKPAFGTSTTPTTGTGLFGQGTGGVSGFGAANNGQTGAFGAPATAFQPGTLQSEGTGGVPFAPSTEKEVGPNNTAGPNNVFQSITMMAQYQKFSFEELRLADYAQGRRYGNASNQPGAFGANTGFGGFGNTNTNTGTGFGAGAGGFGAANNPTTGFGTNQQATGAFGANTGGNNLFGTKPFGQTNNATTSAQTSGGLFGTTPATTGNTGFAGGNPFGGANNNNNNNQTGGLNFGGTGTTGGAGFGATGNTGGFGTSNTGGGGGGLFGNTNAAAASTTFGGAGQQQQQPTNPNPFGGFGQAQGQNQQNQNATPAFGTPNQNAQAKPGGLFGNIGTNPAGGGFQLGGNNQATQGTGAFGLGANNNAGGGLDIFGKPLNQAPSPFGNLANNQNNTGNAAAGNNAFGGFTLNPPNQQNQAAGLLGNANQNQQKPSLFGNLGTTNNNAGNAFGNLAKPADNQQLGGGLLGFNNQNQQQPLGGALLGNANFLGATLQNQQQVQQPMGLSTSINDIDPFGGIQLFNGLGLPTAQNIGPIATPLSSAQKTKKNSILPHYKYNPSASTRLMTPQTRGFGFSYSTYGSPSSFSSSVSTPVGLSSSLLGSTIGRTLGKSLSTSNLRRTFDADDSVLAASAFSPNGNRYANTGSLKKLVINRSLRSDLFSQPPNDVSGALPAPDKTDRPQQANGTKKRVSFEPRSSGGHNGESATEPSQVNGSRGSPNGRNGSSPSPNGNNTNGTVESDGEEVRGNELAVVHEDGTPPQPTKSTKTFKGFRNPHADKKIGEYWMSPSMEDLKKMSREDLKHVNGLKIGRRGCGSVEFQTPVDLTTIDLDKIIDVIVVIITRSCTVYPDASVKPEVGKGLNVPARITLENSWPRSDRGRREVFERSGPKYEKHLTRLQRVEMTHFESYDPETGTWIFTVDHFTTYGIDYDEDESVAESGLSVLPNTPQPSSSNAQGLPSHNEDDSMNGDDELDTSFNPDDTFEYKKRKPPPGHLGEPELYEEDDQPNNAQEDQSTGESFFGERSMGSSSRNGVNESNVIQSQGDAIGKDESVIVRDQVMAGSYPDVDHTMGPSENPLQKKSVERGSLGSISPSNSRLNLQRSLLHFDTPVKSKLQLDDDWVEHLGRTISPRKQDRKALRELQENILQDDALEDADATPKARTEAPPNERGIHTSIDLMRSLFGQDQGRKGEKVKDQARVANAGFEV